MTKVLETRIVRTSTSLPKDTENKGKERQIREKWKETEQEGVYFVGSRSRFEVPYKKEFVFLS